MNYLKSRCCWLLCLIALGLPIFAGCASSPSGSVASTKTPAPPADGTLFAVTFAAGGANGQATGLMLIAIDPATGTTLWSSPFSGNASSQLLPSDLNGTLVIDVMLPSTTTNNPSARQLTGYSDATGQQLWQTTLMQGYIAQFSAGAGLLAYSATTSDASHANIFTVIDAKTGKTRWQMANPIEPLNIPNPPPTLQGTSTNTAGVGFGTNAVFEAVASGSTGNAVLPFYSALIAHDLQTGKALWTTSLNALGIADKLVVAQGQIFATISAAEPNTLQKPPMLAAFDATTGKLQWSSTQPGVVQAVTNGTMLALQGDIPLKNSNQTKVLAFNAATGAPLWQSSAIQIPNIVSAREGRQLLAVQGNQVVVPAINPNSSDVFNQEIVLGLSLATGQPDWTISGGVSAGSAVVGNGSVFAPTVELTGTLTPGQPPSINNFKSFVAAFAATTGKLEWKQPTSMSIVGVFEFVYALKQPPAA